MSLAEYELDVVATSHCNVSLSLHQQYFGEFLPLGGWCSVSECFEMEKKILYRELGLNIGSEVQETGVDKFEGDGSFWSGVVVK